MAAEKAKAPVGRWRQLRLRANPRWDTRHVRKTRNLISISLSAGVSFLSLRFCEGRRILNESFGEKKARISIKSLLKKNKGNE